jgi:hypothetical protein
MIIKAFSDIGINEANLLFCWDLRLLPHAYQWTE